MKVKAPDVLPTQAINSSAAALRAAGADVVMHERVGAHGDVFWQHELPRMVRWAFGP